MNWRIFTTNVVLILILAAGSAAKIERWKRKYGRAMRLTSEHVVSLFVLAGAVLVMEMVNRSGTLIDPIDYVDALRWPAVSVLFIALCLTCQAFVDGLGVLAGVASRRKKS